MNYYKTLWDEIVQVRQDTQNGARIYHIYKKTFGKWRHHYSTRSVYTHWKYITESEMFLELI